MLLSENVALLVPPLLHGITRDLLLAAGTTLSPDLVYYLLSYSKSTKLSA